MSTPTAAFTCRPVTERSTEDQRDSELMQQAACDDPEAFALLLPRLRKTITCTLRLFLPLFEQEDGLADVESRIWLKRKQFDDRRGTVRCWTRAIARRYGLDYLRRQKLPFTTIGPESDPADCKQSDPADIIEQAEWADIFHRLCAFALASMPPYAAVAWRLRLEGKTLKEIALTLGGKSNSSIAGSLSRTSRKIHNLLQSTDFVGTHGDHLMAIDPATIADQLAALMRKQDDLHRQATDQDLKDLLTTVGDRLEALLLEKTNGNRKAEQSVRLAELMDTVCKLAPFKDRLPNRLFTRLWTHADELRKRFLEHGFDNYAFTQTTTLARRVRQAIG